MKKSICLVLILFLFTFAYSADLVFDGSNKIKTGSLVKGLVGHWSLDSESEKVGSDLVTNGDFDDWTGDNPDSWTVTGESGTDPEVSEVGNNEGHGGAGTGACNIYTTANSIYLNQNVFEIGKTYILNFDITKRVSGGLRVNAGEMIDQGMYIEQAYSYIFTATSQTLQFCKYGTINLTIDNVIVKEIHTADKTPYSNDGVVHGASYTTDQKGQSNRAMSFDGVDDYVDLGEDKPTDLTGDITISVWINPEGWGEYNYGHLISNGKFISCLYQPSGRLNFGSAGSVIVHTANNSIILNTWQHVLITRPSAGTNTNIYINGVLSGTANQNSGTPEAGTTNTFIGNNNNGDRTFDGQISELKTYNRILSPEEITLLYENYRPRFIFSGE